MAAMWRNKSALQKVHRQVLLLTNARNRLRFKHDSLLSYQMTSAVHRDKRSLHAKTISGKRMKNKLFSMVIIIAATISLTTISSVIQAEEVTQVQFDQWMEDLSNWGRWGDDDQLGALNLITPGKKVAAAKLVSAGKTISMARTMPVDSLPKNALANRPPVIKGSAVNVYGIDIEHGYFWERYEVEYHGSDISHVDALCHVAYQGKVYNGASFVEVASKDTGCGSHNVMALKDGVLTRGVLIDLPGVEVKPKDILDWEKKTGIRIASGDAVFLRSGRDIYKDGNKIGGFHPSLIPFIKDRDIALLGSDSYQEVRSKQAVGLPIHIFSLVGLGVHLLDNLSLEALSETAAEMNRWEFMFVAAPHTMPSGSGAAINPIAVF